MPEEQEQELDPYFDAVKILEENDATVSYSDTAIDSNGKVYRSAEYAGWSLLWEYGAIGWPRPNWTEEQAQRAGAMFIYLWKKKVDTGHADTLASLFATHMTMRLL